MAMSGVSFDDKCMDAFNSLKTGEKKDKVRALVFKISDDKQKIIMDKEWAKEAGATQEDEYNEIIKTLPSNCGRFVVWDLDIDTKSGQRAGKLFCMFWSPEDAGVKDRMLYSSSSSAVKDKLMMKMVTVTDKDESEYNNFLEAGRK